MTSTRSEPAPGVFSLRVVFLGSGDFAHGLLRRLLEDGCGIAAVIIPPERPAGRGLRIKASPLKVLARERGLPLLQPGEPRQENYVAALREQRPDLVLVTDYGHILPAAVLEIPPSGCLNVHPSLLPRYRGAAPIQRALMDGVEKTGVSLMLLDEGMDTGPVICQREAAVGGEDDAGILRERLASLAARMVIEELPRYLAGEAVPRPQDERTATYAPPIAKGEYEIDWSRPAADIHNLVRALAPRPGAFTTLRGKRIKILRARLADRDANLAPGEMAALDGETFVAGCADGAISLELVQPEGRKAMTAGEFLRGYR